MIGWLERDGLRLAVHGADGDGPPLVFQHGLCGDAGQVAEALAGLGRPADGSLAGTLQASSAPPAPIPSPQGGGEPQDDAGPAQAWSHGSGVLSSAPPSPHVGEGWGEGATRPQRWRTLECRGHGASDMGDPSIAVFADDVAALVQTLPFPVVLGGISMGAAIACRLAVDRPDLVRALVLVRPAWVTDSAPPNMAPNAEVGALLARLPPAEAWRVFEASATAARLAAKAPDNLVSLLGFFGRTPQAATARLLTAIAADGPDISPADLRALRLPVLVCGTGEDLIHPLAHARALADLIPGSRLVELPPKGQDRATHFAALTAALMQFLNEV